MKHKTIQNKIPNLPTRLNSFSLLVKIYEGQIGKTVSEEELIDEAVILLKNPKLCDNKKIAFLTEQLMLACVLPHKRHYSSSLLAMSVMWLKISPTAYRHNYQEGILTLCNERRLQRLTSSANVNISAEMLHSTSIEKTNIGHADACFHGSIINALWYYSGYGHSEFAETAEVLQHFRNWFNATDVKSLFLLVNELKMQIECPSLKGKKEMSENTGVFW